MEIDNESLDRFRRGCGEVENHVVDEFLAGRLSRRDFLRRGTVVGLSLPVLGGILAACGSSGAGTTTTRAASGGSNATILAGIEVPAAAIDPITVADQGGQDMLAQTGEYLCLADQQLRLRPVLATSWKPSSGGSVWTFKIRPGVKFSDGTPMTVDDVVYTFKSQSNPKGATNALSAFEGVLLPDGVVKAADDAVEFHLEAPNGNFPYLCSTDNYNMIIVPNGYDFSKWQSSFIGTGPFIKTSYTPNVGATFVRNPSYWGNKALPAKTEFSFYSEEAPMTAALESGSIDVVGQFSVSGSPQLLTGGYNVINLKASTHRELAMRNDIAPFTNKFVRQAIAYTLDRPAIVKALFKGYAQVGNDSPFAPVFPSTNSSVPQRKQDLRLAKELLAKGGVPNGFSSPLVTETTQEMPRFAEIVSQSAAAIGVKINLTVETPTKYYGSAVFGKSDWLDAEMSLVDYGHRSVPNVLLTAPLETNGPWNGARFKDPTYDALVKQYIASVDLSTQRQIAGQIEELLLDETPIIYAYFYNFLTATAKNVSGVYPTAIGHLFLYDATKT
jgi:peptide/nickel transport system substrate-binding protein